jgi:hypothetical protein
VYWKDKLEEQLDYALGIHEQGKHYKRWQQDMRSHQRQSPGLINLNSRIRKAFWEEDGNIMAVLLGKKKHHLGSTHSRHKVDFQVHTMTSVFYLAFKLFFLILSRLCRWASCRGTLPQPLVVFTLLSSIISAPRNKRIFMVGITIIAIRTLAEMVHGYKYSHFDWEEEEEKDDDTRYNRTGFAK